jgi:hypothetical protein
MLLSGSLLLVFGSNDVITTTLASLLGIGLSASGGLLLLKSWLNSS